MYLPVLCVSLLVRLGDVSVQGYDSQTSVEFDESVPPFAVACAAAQRTLVFTIVLLLLLSLILTQRPAFRQPSSLATTPPGSGREGSAVLATQGGEQEGEGVSLGQGMKHVDFVLQYTSELFDLNHRGADSMLYLFCLLIAVGMDEEASSIPTVVYL